jgi:hypothetical protein
MLCALLRPGQQLSEQPRGQPLPALARGDEHAADAEHLEGPAALDLDLGDRRGGERDEPPVGGA